MGKNLALILAGGTGSRMSDGLHLPKQFLELDGKTILQHSIESFENHGDIDCIFVVIHAVYFDRGVEIIRGSHYRKVVKILRGGETRQDSSFIGVMAAQPGEFENILIHDAARPFISREIIDSILEKLTVYPAVNIGVPSSDTILEVDDNNLIKSVPNRNYLRRAQTPQSFKLTLIQQAHRLAKEHGVKGSSDDCMLILRFNLAPVYVMEGDPLNIKITYPIDFLLAEKIREAIRDKNEKKK
jgi:ribitol-5-phosphate 2-dehydrogenase (NADP+) / D-ribitol-5-phosphate cytidylyltransferase